MPERHPFFCLKAKVYNTMHQNASIKGPDATAVRTALWRALHVQIDQQPLVFKDDIGLQLVSPEEGWQRRPDMMYTRRLRASIVARARFVEDLVMEQYSRGTGQYVILGAGLDSFAQRRPLVASQLQIFEMDQPDTLSWKQSRLIDLGYNIPDTLHFVPVDFETSSWWNELLKTSFNVQRPALVVCTGVMLYLTQDAVIDTLKKLKRLATGSTLALTFNLPVELVEEEDKPLIEMAVEGARESGTPMISFFSPEEILQLAREVGFENPVTVSTKEMKQRYFADRTDGLLPASGEIFLLAST